MHVVQPITEAGDKVSLWISLSRTFIKFWKYNTVKFLQDYALCGTALYGVFFIGIAIPTLAALITLCVLRQPGRQCAHLT